MCGWHVPSKWGGSSTRWGWRCISAVRRAATELAGPLTAEAVVRIFERIIDEARRAERQESERRHGV
jgi:hypothetical protein